MNGFLHYYFAPISQAWWTGNVYGNIIASILTGAVVILCTRFIFKHLKLQHHAHLELQERHHKELLSLLSANTTIDGEPL